MTTTPITTPPSINFDRLDKLPDMRIVRLHMDPNKLRVHWFHPEVSVWLDVSQLRELARIVNAAILAAEAFPPAEQPALPLTGGSR